jgi:transposase InsO family protein
LKPRELTPRDHAEAIAVFRAEIVGALTKTELAHGDLAAELTALSKKRYRPPGSHGPRSYAVSTLERWLYDYKAGGVDALRPRTRSDKGRGRDLSPELRELLLDIRREHPRTSIPIILATLQADGRIEPGLVSESTVRRLYVQEGLDRVTLSSDAQQGKVRLRWAAERPGALWHGDVCHVRLQDPEGGTQSVRIHALLDDASRYIVAIEARHAECEIDMLEVFVGALRRHGAPDGLYLDNGSTYRGQTLSLACARLGIALIHARPYDAPARGKMERFWRTLRGQCLAFAGALASLHELNVRLYAWLDEHYHRAVHGGLMGKTPAQVYESIPRPVDGLDEARLRDALTIQVRRRVRRDNTLSMDGRDWETSLHFLAGRLVTVGRCLVTPDEAPWIEHEDQRFDLHPVDAVRNAHRSRSPSNLDTPHPARVPFDPPGALLDKSLGRKPRAGKESAS